MNKTITSDFTSASIGSKVHVFEVAGLGKAPFRFQRFTIASYQACHGAPVQPGTSCDFCGTAIMNVFWIKGSATNDREFKVGCDCVEKTNDYGLRRVVDAEVKRHQKARKAVLDGMKIAEVESLVAREDVREILASKPHPFGFTGKTSLDYAQWMLKNSGVSGKTRVLKMVKSALA